MLSSVKAGVSRFYYVHGLFCTKYSIVVLTLSLIITFLFVYPLRNVSLWEFPPHEYETAFAGYEPPSSSSNAKRVADSAVNKPRWYHSPPVAYIQQIYLHTSVSVANVCAAHNNAECLVLSSLYNAYDLLDAITAFRKANAADFEVACLRLNATRSASSSNSGSGSEDARYESDCISVSPLSLWNADRVRFATDPRLADVRSETRASRRFRTDTTFRDALFGVRFEETGIGGLLERGNASHLHTAQQDASDSLTFALTLLFRRFDEPLVIALHRTLTRTFGQLGDSVEHSETEQATDAEVVHVRHGHIAHLFFAHAEYLQFVPIGASYVLVFVYTVFAVRNVELLRSRVGLAVSACATLILTTLITLGVYAHSNALPRLSGGEVFPYLVVVLGFDNLTSVTRAIVGTPIDLDVRFRVALGLSKLGWLNLRNRITVVLVSLAGCLLQLDLVASGLRDFSRLALVAALADYFLQMFFFVPVLALDLRRMELFDLHRRATHKSRSSPPFSRLSDVPPSPTHLDASPADAVSPSVSVPLAKGVLHFVPCFDLVRNAFASLYVSDSQPRPGQKPRGRPLTPFVRRLCYILVALVLLTVLWFTIALYALHDRDVDNIAPGADQSVPLPAQSQSPVQPLDLAKSGSSSGSTNVRVPHDTWKRLSGNHWPVLFELFGIDLAGSYVSILPPIVIETMLTSGAVRRFRDAVQDAARLARLPFDAFDAAQNSTGWLSVVEMPRAHIFELVGFSGLVALLVALLGYICLVSAYSCCRLSISQDIANIDAVLHTESSADRPADEAPQSASYSRLLALKPLCLGAHRTEVQYAATGRRFAATVCLLGELKLWATDTGELLHSVRLSSSPHQPDAQLDPQSKSCELDAGDNSLRRRNLSEKFPDLSRTIKTTFRPSAGIYIKSESQSRSDANFETFLKATVAPLYNRHRDREQTRHSSSSDSDSDEDNRSPWSLAFCEHADATDTDAACNSESERQRCELKAALLFVAYSDGSLDVFNALTGRALLTNWRPQPRGTRSHAGVVFLSASCARQKLAVGRLDGTVELLEFQFSLCKAEEAGGSTASAVSPCIYSVTLNAVHALEKHLESVTTLQLCRDRLVTGSFDRTVKVFDCNSGSLVSTLYGHSQAVTALRCRVVPSAARVSHARTPSYTTLTRASRSNLSTMQSEAEAENRGVLVCVSGAKDGKLCVNYVPLADSSRQQTQAHELCGMRQAVMNVELTPDTHLVVAIDADRNLCVWRRWNSQLLHTVPLANTRPAAFCFDLLIIHRYLLVPTANSLDVLDMASSDRIDSCRLTDADQNGLEIIMDSIGTLTHALAVAHSDANAVLCTCGKRVLLVRFPLLTSTART